MAEKKSSRWIIGLTGRNASGKGEAARLLVERGYEYRSLSDALREEAATRGLSPSRESLIELGRSLREKEGPAVLAIRTVAALAGPRYVIDSIRNVKEIEVLRHAGHFLLLGVDAPIEVRFKRAQSRGREENASTLEEFQALEERERTGGLLAQHLDACLELADEQIVNDGEITDLSSKIDRVLSSRGYPVQSK